MAWYGKDEPMFHPDGRCCNCGHYHNSNGACVIGMLPQPMVTVSERVFPSPDSTSVKVVAKGSNPELALKPKAPPKKAKAKTQKAWAIGPLDWDEVLSSIEADLKLVQMACEGSAWPDPHAFAIVVAIDGSECARRTQDEIYAILTNRLSNVNCANSLADMRMMSTLSQPKPSIKKGKK